MWRNLNHNYARFHKGDDPNKGRLFKEMPVDIFFEIASHLTQRDALVLCQTSKQLRAFLISPTANHLWISLRSASLIRTQAEIPD